MIFSFANFLRGYLIITAHGFYTERFINLCMKCGIYLWNIKKTGKTSLQMNVSIRGFFRMRDAARKTQTSLHIIKRCGLPLFLHRYRKRKAFAAGIAVFIAFNLFMCSFIWSVEIVGCKKISEDEIRNALSTCGIRTGVLKYNKKPSEIKEQMLNLVPSLSWAWVYINGTKAQLVIKEKTEKPDIVPENIPCNIVATHDGIIDEYIVKSGITMIQRGDVVKKGQLLVSGVADRQQGGYGLLHSIAKVKAVTWHDKSHTYPLVRQDTVKTGKVQNKYSFRIFSLNIPLYFQAEPRFSKYTMSEHKNQLKLWGNFYLPVFTEKKTYEETVVKPKRLTEKEAVLYYGDMLYKQTAKELSPDAEIKDKTISHTLGKNGNITINCSLKCREEIGETKIIGETN